MRFLCVALCSVLLLNLCVGDGGAGRTGVFAESYIQKPYIGTPSAESFFETKLPLALSDLQYHGTTTLSFKHEDSVIVCVDSKASVGEYVGSRTVRKVFPVSKSIVATMAGGAADCAFWIRYISRVAKFNEYRYDTNLNAKAIARLLSAELKKQKQKVSSKEGQNDGLSVGTMVAGWAKAEGPSLFYVDSSGACIEGDMFCVGSGAQFAYAILDSVRAGARTPSEGKPTAPLTAESVASSLSTVDIPSYGQSLKSNKTHRGNVLSRLSFQEAIDTAVRAVRHATYRDGFSGGYINVLVVNATGIHHIKRIDSRTVPI